MAITIIKIIDEAEYIEAFPQDANVEEDLIKSAINRATITLDAICGGMITKVWSDLIPSTDPLYRTAEEKNCIKQATLIQAQYNVSRNLDMSAGTESYTSGSNNYNETRPRADMVADEIIYQLLARARVYDPNISTDTTIRRTGGIEDGFYDPSYDPGNEYVTYNVGDNRYVFKHDTTGANKYLKYDTNGNIITDTISVSPTGTSSAIANFITIGGLEYQIGGSGGGGSPSQYLQTASVSGNTLTITEINGSSPTPITYTPTGFVENPGLEVISHLPYNFAYHFYLTTTANSVNGTIYTITLDNNKTTRTWPISIPGATSSTAGVMTANDKQTLSTRAEDFSVDGTTIKWKSGATRTLESGIPSAVHFKGVVASTTDLPASPSEGDLYYVGTAQPYNIYIYNGSGWIAAGTSSIDLSKIVTTDTDQEISGSKTFQGTTKIDKHATFTIDNDATWTNSTTTISSSSTDNEYPTAKTVYDYVGDYLKTITGYDASKTQGLYNNKGNIVWAENKPTEPAWWDDVSSLTIADIGTEKDIIVNGVTHKVRLIGIDHDDKADGSGKAHTTWEFKTLISDANGYSLATLWKNTATTSGSNYDYLNSDIRKALEGEGSGTANWFEKGSGVFSTTYANTSVMDMLPTNLKSKLVEVTKSVNINSGGTWTATNYDTKLFLLSPVEMGYSPSSAGGLEGSTYNYYVGKTAQTDASRIKQQQQGSTGALTSGTSITGSAYGSGTSYAGYNSATSGEGGIYWLRSPYTSSTGSAWRVVYTGGVDHYGVYSIAIGVSPCFCI